MDDSQSAMGDARAQVQDAAERVGEQARETTSEARSKAADRVRQQVDTRSTQAGEQVQSVAQAMRRTGEQLRGEQQELPAKVLDAAAERAERVGSYLEQSSADELLGQVEDFARRRPWMVAAGGFALGLVGSRLLKASSSSRYQRGSESDFTRRQDSHDGTPQTDYIPPATPAIPSTPLGETAITTPREGF